MAGEPDEPEQQPDAAEPDSLIKSGGTGERRSNGRFAPGCSGNLRGRPVGARKRITRAIEEMLAGEAEEVTRALLDRAKAGNTEALKLYMDRMSPVRRDAPIEFELPPVATLDELPEAHLAVLQEVAAGNLTPDEGLKIVNILNARQAAIELRDIAERLAVLEEMKGN